MKATKYIKDIKKCLKQELFSVKYRGWCWELQLVHSHAGAVEYTISIPPYIFSTLQIFPEISSKFN